MALCGEAGEVADKVKKIIRDKDGRYYAPDLAAIAMEIGDVLWYGATLAKALGYDLNSVAELMIAREISGLTIPNLIVYGGGESCKSYCRQQGLIYIDPYQVDHRNNCQEEVDNG